MATADPDPPPPAAVVAEIKDVVGRAKRGDAAALPRLRELLDRHPLLWHTYGNLAAQVECHWVGLAAGNDLHLKESLTRYAAKLRADLTRSGAAAVEGLLVERVVACWVRQNYFSGVEAAAISAGGSVKLLQHRAKREAQAQRAYERALAALVVVQRLLPPGPVVSPLPPVEAADALKADKPAATAESATAGAEAVPVEGAEVAEKVPVGSPQTSIVPTTR